MTKKTIEDNVKKIKQVVLEAIKLVETNTEGRVATYIPELASVDEELTGVAVRLTNNTIINAGNTIGKPLTLQSAAKLVVLIGLLEEYGPEQLFSWVKVEPSGDDFASIARLDQFGPSPSNPMLNAGAITLCSHVPGNAEEKVIWLESWMERLFGKKLHVNATVLASEKRTGDRNRSLAYLLKSNDKIAGDVEEALSTYFCLCAFETDVVQASYLPMLLANKGMAPDGERIISHSTVRNVVTIMATCGLYNESGSHLVRTGMPAKSAVSGYILSVALHHAGIAVMSPRVNRKGTSIRGAIILEHIGKTMGWHFVD